jgi:phospholipase C
VPDLKSLFGPSGPVKHVVILMQENRAFDEYFGIFPGAEGLASLTRSQAEAIWTGNGGSPNPCLPYRLSSFTTPVAREGIQDHNPAGQHASWAGGALNGWVNSGNGYNSYQCVAYFAENDIPFHWWLAQNFLLCDHHFSSVIGNTLPNRLYLMTGTAIDPRVDPTSSAWPQDADTTAIFYSNAGAGAQQVADSYNPPSAGYSPDNPNNMQGANWVTPTWNTYPDCLTEAGFASWKIYDGSQDPDPNVDANGGGDMSIVTYFPKTWQTLFSGNPSVMPSGNLTNFVSATATVSALDQLVLDIQSNSLPQVSWVIPPIVDAEWPAGGKNGAGAPWNGAVLISKIYNALLAHPDVWASTVFILTYDENDGHYDHVAPIVPGLPQSTQPTANTSDYFYMSSMGNYQPIGAGFRVPTIIISPWTFKGGICSLPFDHTSTLRLLEEFTGVSCTTPGSLNTDNRNISDWRWTTFLSHSAIPIGDLTPAGAIPACPDAVAIQTAVTARQNAQPANASGYAGWPNPPALSTQPWPPVGQTQYIQLILPSGSGTFDLAQALQTAGSGGSGDATNSTATFSQALQVVVYGFEPEELIHPNAVGPLSQNVSVKGGGSCTTRVPQITFPNNPDVSVDYTTVQISYNPQSPDMPDGDTFTPGVPYVFTFFYDLVFSNITTLFPPVPAAGQASQTIVVPVDAAFQSDATFYAQGEIELVSVADPQFYENFYADTIYISGELVVFSLPAGQPKFGAQLGDPSNPAATDASEARAFIQKVIKNLKNGTASQSDFDALNQAEDANALTLATAPAGTAPTYNFALARVHNNSPITAPNVRVFFRVANAQITSGAYDATGGNTGPSYQQAFYRSNPATGPGTGPGNISKVPLLGVKLVTPAEVGAAPYEYVNIPFFATKRVDPNTQSMVGQVYDGPNVKSVPAATSAGPGVEYFGCWLDFNTGDAIIPTNVPTGSDQWDGPWDSAQFPGGTQIVPINQIFRDGAMHQCLVAEISYDPIVIAPNDAPGASAWLAQRNLAFSS